jgi:hypothetical protein
MERGVWENYPSILTVCLVICVSWCEGRICDTFEKITPLKQELNTQKTETKLLNAIEATGT